MTEKPTNEQLEYLIDCEGLDTLLGSIVDICSAKAEHCRSAWQDERAAQSWEGTAADLGALIKDL